MTIGIVGSGAVGTTLARGLSERGHQVTLGTRHPDDHRALEPAVRIGAFADAARDGEVVILAVRWSAVDDVFAAIGPETLRGKVLIDASNPLRYENGRPVGLETPAEGSAGQRVAALAPGARVVKAFNVVGAGMMVAPQIAGGPPDMFVCGDDADAKRVVSRLCDDLGYPALDVGPLARAAELEHLAMLWISLAMTGAFAKHAFALLREPNRA